MKRIFLENLPKWGNGFYAKEGSVNWLKSIGYIIKFIYDDAEGWIEIVDYDGKYLYIKYQDKEIFRIFTGDFQQCKLGKLLGKHTKNFKIEIGTTFKDDKRDITIIDRKIRPRHRKEGRVENDKWYKYICNKCSFECGEHYKNGEFKEEYWIEESNLLKGVGCACCCSSPKIVVPHINSIVANPETHWMIKYFQGGYDEAKRYTKSSSQKIKPVCPDCCRIKEKEVMISNVYHSKSIGCLCGDGFSYGHKYIHNLLTQLNLAFKDNKTFDWCRFYNPYKKKETTGEYDFVLENHKLIIEVDGEWHRKDNSKSGQTKEHSKYLDDMKDLLAEQHDYSVIRISDEDNIKDNVLNSQLISIFNLSNIEWDICNGFALNNRCKEVCKIKRDNPDIPTVEICEIMRIDKTTIIDYLKKGTKLGWCNYDPKEEIRKSRIKLNKTGKQVEVFKDGISLGIFESTAELKRKSEELFGVRFNNTKISAVCLDKRPHHKGFTFKYIKPAV